MICDVFLEYPTNRSIYNIHLKTSDHYIMISLVSTRSETDREMKKLSRKSMNSGRRKTLSLAGILESEFLGNSVSTLSHSLTLRELRET